MRKQAEENCSLSLRNILSDLIFVGCVNEKQTLIQHETMLYLCDNQKLGSVVCYPISFEFKLINFLFQGGAFLPDFTLWFWKFWRNQIWRARFACPWIDLVSAGIRREWMDAWRWTHRRSGHYSSRYPRQKSHYSTRVLQFPDIRRWSLVATTIASRYTNTIPI